MSELHNRLSHLVNYSSQLIFVSGDSLAVQQRTLSEFIASQQENTEISFFSATADQSPIEYRAAICRQLGGHVVGSFVRPLNQLLEDPVTGLRAENGPYLVCITQSEKLSEGFLQELWDWVMQAQLGDEKIHLNIILFGEANWARRSQEYLPIQNSHKPVLLSSESIDPVGFDVNALEALMADKGSWLSTSNQPIVSNKWFIGSVLSLFLLTFVGLMTWQYPSLIESLSAAEQASVLTQNENGLDQQKAVDAQSKHAQINSKANDLDEITSRLEVVKIPSSESQANSIANGLLVTSWKNDKSRNTSLSNISSHPTQTPNQTALKLLSSPEEVQTVNGEVRAADTIPISIADPLSDDTSASDDFQVPDIISVEQLNEQLFVTQQLSLTRETEMADNNDLEQTNLNESTIDYQFDETTLLSLPTDAIVLQLSGIKNPDVLENYLNSNNLKASTWVYQTQRYGSPWYVVLYNQAFASIDAALNQRSNLPIDQRETQAFAKSIDQIQEEISRR